MEILEKPLSKRQQEELAQFVATSTTLLRVGVFILFTVVLGAILRGIQIKTFDAPPIWAGVTTAIAILVFVKSKKWTGGPEYRKSIQRDLDAGMARVTVIEPAFVTEIEELEDEGPSYIIETKQGQSILLTGQWLVWTRKRKFPWSKFEITEAPDSGYFFGVRKQGKPFPVGAKRDAFTYEQARDLGCFESNYILLDDNARKILQQA